MHPACAGEGKSPNDAFGDRRDSVGPLVSHGTLLPLVVSYVGRR